MLLNLKEYGEISGNFFVKKRKYNVVYKNGVRVYQFRKLTKDIPEFIQIMGKRTKVIYTGQKKRERAPYVNVLNQQRAINEATCSIPCPIAQLLLSLLPQGANAR